MGLFVSNVPRLFPLELALAVIACVSVIYTVYQLFLHPLAKYPGPLLCRLTDLKKVQYYATKHVDTEILKLHQQYGPVVRIAPNELSFWTPGAVAPIYKSGRTMGKAPFYDAFTALQPNLFGMRDEELHALRRRQMAHSFSSASLTKMEAIFDRHLQSLREKLDGYASRNETFDLKNLVNYYTYDVLGQLAFSTNFESQKHDDPSELPPIDDHVWLSTLFGSITTYMPYSVQLGRYIPNAWLQGLYASRAKIRNTALTHVRQSMAHPEKDDLHSRTLLSHLMTAEDPETGAKLTELDIGSEAFAFLVAGSHTTAASSILLLYHILHNAGVFQAVSKEMTGVLPYHSEGGYSYTGLENKLAYTTACIRESFRVSPVFTMPLTREVMPAGGFEVDGHYLPKGTKVSISNYSLHHNPTIWGSDASIFRPTRWLEDASYTKEKLSYLMHFGQGHRACIGRNIAMINIVKVVTVLMRCYELEAVDRDEVLNMVSVGIGEKEGPLLCRARKRS